MIGLWTRGGETATWPTFARFALATVLTVGTLGGALGAPVVYSDTSGASDLPVDGGGTALRPDDLLIGGWSAPRQGRRATPAEAPVYAGGARVGGVVFDAYRAAAAWAARTDPSCNLHWSLLAGVGHVESHHAAGVAVTKGGDTYPRILGPSLNGVGDFAAIYDTDGGRFDSDPTWDRAVGPMQFIPSSWRLMGVDGNRDGQLNPNNVYDAAAAAARYLCAGDRDLSRRVDAQSAVYGYNHSWEYVALVLSLADMYANGVLGIDRPAYVTASSDTSGPRLGRTQHQGGPPAATRTTPPPRAHARARAGAAGTKAGQPKGGRRARHPRASERPGAARAAGHNPGQQGMEVAARQGRPVAPPLREPVGPPAGTPEAVPGGPPAQTPAPPPSVAPRPTPPPSAAPKPTPQPPSVTPRPTAPPPSATPKPTPPSVAPRPTPPPSVAPRPTPPPPSVTPNPPSPTPKPTPPPSVTPKPTPPPAAPPAGGQPTSPRCPTPEPTEPVAEVPAPTPTTPPGTVCRTPGPAATPPPARTGAAG